MPLLSGAIFKKMGSKGEFMSGIIELDGTKHEFVAFRNVSAKGKEYFRIQPDRPREQRGQEINRPAAPKVEDHKPLDDEVPF